MMLYALVIPGVIFVFAFCMMVRGENRCARRDEDAMKMMAHYSLPDRMMPTSSHIPRTLARRKPTRPSIE